LQTEILVKLCNLQGNRSDLSAQEGKKVLGKSLLEGNHYFSKVGQKIVPHVREKIPFSISIMRTLLSELHILLT
jgi:hypothetical protein